MYRHSTVCSPSPVISVDAAVHSVTPFRRSFTTPSTASSAWSHSYSSSCSHDVRHENESVPGPITVVERTELCSCVIAPDFIASPFGAVASVTRVQPVSPSPLVVNP